MGPAAGVEPGGHRRGATLHPVEEPAPRARASEARAAGGQRDRRFHPREAETAVPIDSADADALRRRDLRPPALSRSRRDRSPPPTRRRNFVNDKDHRQAHEADRRAARLARRTTPPTGCRSGRMRCARNGMHQGGVGTHGNYRQWIFNNFEQNKPTTSWCRSCSIRRMPNHPPRYVLNDKHMRTVQCVRRHRAGLPRHRHQVRELPQPFPQRRVAAVAGARRSRGSSRPRTWS